MCCEGGGRLLPRGSLLGAISSTHPGISLGLFFLVDHLVAHDIIAAVVLVHFDRHLDLDVKIEKPLGLIQNLLDHLIWNAMIFQVEEAVVFARLDEKYSQKH